MKTLLLATALQTLVITVPTEKAISAIDFGLYGFNVVSATAVTQLGKQFDYNKIDADNSKFIVYGLDQSLLANNVIEVKGYQTKAAIKLKDIHGASPSAEPITIVQRYKQE